MNDNDETRTANNPPPDEATRTAHEPPDQYATPSLPTNGYQSLGEVDGTAAAPTGPPQVALQAESPVPPGFTIEAELGRGGMGVVYKARQVRLGRVVALKMLLRGFRDAKLRFLAEAEAVAAVRHPNVIQVHDYGEHNGHPFLALEYLSGDTLAERLKVGRFDARPAAELVGKITLGVAAAHAAGIVHRDLKPANVLFDTDGEPKVSDFGIAKRGDGAELTHTGAIMGTPHYMSPEQAGGRTKFVGPPADVWALGVILYECLTGERPFVADSVDGVLSRVLMDEPIRPRKVMPAVPRDLELICLKCLEKNPADRYPTATELADDLRRLVAGEPVSVRSAGPAERVLKWARRKPTAAAAWGFSGLAVLLTVVSFVIFGFWRDAETAKGTAESTRDQLDEALGSETKAKEQVQGLLATESQLRDKLQHSLKAEQDAVEQLERFKYGQTMLLAHQAWRDNEVAAARVLLASTREDFRGWEYHYVHRLCHADSFAASHAVIGSGHVAFRPDGLRLLTFGSDGFTVRDVPSGVVRRLPLIGHNTFLSPDGSRVVVLHNDGTAQLWDADTGIMIAKLNRPAVIPEERPFTAFEKEVFAKSGLPLDGLRVIYNSNRTVHFCQNASVFLTIDPDHAARIWSARTGEEVAVLRGGEGRISFMSASHNGSRVATWGKDVATIWDARTRNVISVCRTPAKTITSVQLSANGSHALTESDDKIVRVWDVASGTGRVVLTDLAAGTGAYLSPDGARILTAGPAGGRLWNAVTGQEQATLQGHRGGVYGPAFSPDGTLIVTTGNDRTARVWDAHTGRERLVVKALRDIHSPRFRADGAQLLAIEDGIPKVWNVDAQTAAEAVDFTGGGTAPHTASFSADGARILTFGTTDPTARVWDCKTAAELAAFRLPAKWGCGAAVSPDGNRVVTFGGDKRYAHVWDVRTGTEVAEFRGHTGPVRSVAFSPDGKRVVSAAAEGTARVWDPATGTELLALKGHEAWVLSAAYSPNGKSIVTASADCTARVWNGATGVVATVFRGHTGEVTAATFSPDGARVLTVGQEGRKEPEVRVWDAATGENLVTAQGLRPTVSPTAFRPDGGEILTVATDGTVRITDVRTKAERTLRGPSGPIRTATFSPDGARILTTDEGAARVWDAGSDVVVAVLRGQVGVWTAAFSADGRRVLMTEQGGRVRVWDSFPIRLPAPPKSVAPAPRAK